jgi:hypothetical protein
MHRRQELTLYLIIHNFCRFWSRNADIEQDLRTQAKKPGFFCENTSL